MSAYLISLFFLSLSLSLSPSLSTTPPPFLLHTHSYTHMHDSDGIGRTGALICIHTQLERLKTEGAVDFFQCIKSARIQRAGFVPDVVC